MRIFYTLVVCLFIVACSKPEDINYYSFVNPFIGTGGHGHTYPGATVPFGFVQLSPDSRLTGWDGCGGYYYSDTVIYGFSHTHLSGTGVSDYGDVLLMPTSDNTFNNGYGLHPDSGYGSPFSHSKEFAEAGYYQVYLEDGKVDVELTASPRAGFHRYTYDNAGQARNLIIDLQHRDELLSWDLKILSNNILQGKRISKAWAREQHVYFHLELSENIRSFSFNKDSSKLILSFDEIDELLIKIGLSAVDIEGAKQNLEAEIPHWSFDQLKEETQAMWDNELGKIQVEMLHDSDHYIFYTALYHSYLCPNIFKDIDGRYRGTDLKIHRSNNHDQYTIFSLWDTFRATHPLFTITQREKTLDFIKTFLDHFEKGGKLPLWELAGNYTGCMIGYHSIPVIVDAYFKGIDDFDTELALKAMVSTAKTRELGKEYFREHGYMSVDEEHESVSKNLEYAYDDWCIAIFAKAIGNDSIYKEFIQSAQYYKNIFDPSTNFLREKRNQQFQEPFDPREVNFNYTEANSWQYSAFVPQDINGLIDLHGGEESFEKHLDSLFHTSAATSGRTQVDITGLIGQYAHGNEPSHHMSYLYNYVGKEYKSQELIRKILREMYTDQADGLIGNEDCGQMSSWYVLSAMGFYPVSPGSDEYILGSPNLKEATLYLENGEQFKISSKNNSQKNIYVKEVYLNGEKLKRSFIRHEEIMHGGELEFVMSEQPQKNFSIHPSRHIEEYPITAVPFITTMGQVFKDSLIIELAHLDSSYQILYSIDESEFQVFDHGFTIRENSRIDMKAISKEGIESKLAKAVFFKRDNEFSVEYKHPYNTQYNGGGKTALVDLLRGGNDFRTGRWQGFQGEDLEVVIDMNKLQDIEMITAGFLQDMRSWIWMPTEVEFFISTDGKSYESVGRKTHTIPLHQEGVFLKDISVKLESRKARYIKLIAKQLGEIPEWHPGQGGQSFIFIDEILVQ